jgi:hypothetical protein
MSITRHLLAAEREADVLLFARLERDALDPASDLIGTGTEAATSVTYN